MTCTDNQPPCLLKKVWNFTLASAKHAVDGFRIVTRDELENRLAICEQCPLLVNQVCTHKDCGCGIRGDRGTFWSKLAWRSETCPDGKWS
jgi:hypothetical protein